MALAWRTYETGFVEVEGRGVPRGFADAVRTCWQKYSPEIRANAERLVMPPTMILATMAVESGGDPTATGRDGEAGLMQLMPFNWRGLSRESVSVPATNIQIGSEMLATYWHANGEGTGVPKVASCYNAGANKDNTPHAKPSDPWGMAESAGYIDKVVAAYNEAIAQLQNAAPSTSSSSSSGGGVPLGLMLMLGKLALDEFGGR